MIVPAFLAFFYNIKLSSLALRFLMNKSEKSQVVTPNLMKAKKDQVNLLGKETWLQGPTVANVCVNFKLRP